VGRAKAAIGSAVFLVIAPGVVAGLIPWLLTRWEVEHELWTPLRVAGGALTAVSAGVLLHSFGRFVLEGIGTPAPVAPTERLVRGGLYRYVRNPMYLAVVGAIVGQALLLGRVELLIYAGVIQLIFVAFVHWYEEPTLREQFGDDYDTYRRAVPGWIPRRRPMGTGKEPRSASPGERPNGPRKR
jgi:protein-S-isoprenylcysteine O-methyltransferase Ste14